MNNASTPKCDCLFFSLWRESMFMLKLNLKRFWKGSTYIKGHFSRSLS